MRGARWRDGRWDDLVLYARVRSSPTELNVHRLRHAEDRIRRKQILGGLIDEYRHAA
jgi:hypothetical protein